jgi:divalent metal cation (Fe/Co/Zn/Cd) transporter
VSFYEGVVHLRHPEPSTSLTMNYIVLGLAALFEGYSWNVARKEMAQSKGKLGYFAAARVSKDPTTFTILFEDSAALAGLLIAFIAITAAHVLEIPELDGVGSMAIGVVLAGTAVFLARESKALLIGEAALPEVEARMREIAESEAGVAEVNGLRTSQLGPEAVIVAMQVAFDDAMETPAIEAAVQRIEDRIRQEMPQIGAVMIKPRGEAAARRGRRDSARTDGLAPKAPQG